MPKSTTVNANTLLLLLNQYVFTSSMNTFLKMFWLFECWVNAQWIYFINIPVVKEDKLEARNIIALATLKEKKIINKAKVENF